VRSLGNTRNDRVPDGDLIVFDVDGVLVDTRFSYPTVIRAAIQWGWSRLLGKAADCTGFSMEHFRASKRHPGFNDDYDIAWALVTVAASASGRTGDPRLSKAMPTPREWEAMLGDFPPSNVPGHVRALYGDLLDRPAFRDLCEEMYLGENFHGRRKTKMKKGLWHAEKPLLECHWRDLALPAAIYTGRFLPELGLALSRLGWEDFPADRVVTPETGISKPSGEGFERLCSLTGASVPVYFGDTESDRESLRRFGRGHFVAIGGLLHGEPCRYDSIREALEDLGLLR